MIERPHFAHPFGRDASGRVKVVEQDEPEHVLACEHRVVLCPVGFRQERPEFGWAWPLHAAVPLDLSELQQALRQFGHPNGRANAREWAAAADEAIRRISVDVEV